MGNFGLGHNLCHMFLNSKTWISAAIRELCKSIMGFITSAQQRTHFLLQIQPKACPQ